MRKYIDTIDPVLPPVTAQAMKYLMAFDHVEELVGKIDAYSGRLEGETERSLGAAASIAQSSIKIGERLDRHLAVLDEKTADREELVAAVAGLREAFVEHTAALRALELRIPDPKQMRREIQADLWQTFSVRILETGELLESQLRAAALEGGSLALEVIKRGHLEPLRPADGAPLRTRLGFWWAAVAFNLRKYSVPITMIGTAVAIAGLFFIAIDLRRAL